MHLDGFIIKEFVTMQHGHLNVKNVLVSVYFGRTIYDVQTASSSWFVYFVFIAYFWSMFYVLCFFFCNGNISPERNVI